MKYTIGKKYRIQYDEYISKLKYEIVAIDTCCYIIGFDKGEEEITGWQSNKYGNKYKLFWAVQENEIVDEKAFLEIE